MIYNPSDDFDGQIHLTDLWSKIIGWCFAREQLLVQLLAS